MSFITKRERVFNEYDLFDLPARNEGKLKGYASCTDARAWSHFCSDKSEHLVEIIKRNNDTGRPKYVPTEAIVNTLMVGKNTEIARLKRKIEESEQMIAAYDELDLTCDQKCEIAKAHAAIKAANKDLDDLFLDLDISGFTEGGDSEAFETGKSRGDETPKSKGDETTYFLSQWTFEKQPTQQDTSNQAGLTLPCDQSTSATDPRIQEMHDTIVIKDAKLSAMQNTIAVYRYQIPTKSVEPLSREKVTDRETELLSNWYVSFVSEAHGCRRWLDHCVVSLSAWQTVVEVMENDVCEPYCIYAHIYTALEKILGILRQNEKYKLYLDLMTTGKDMRYIDIKGKIILKLKMLEKFSLALIAPCSQDFTTTSGQEYACYRAETVTRLETAYALTSAESKQPCLDNKRAHLVADIMENDDMKEILSKENTSLKNNLETDEFGIDNYNIDSENLKRLKHLQENYDELMTCYEAEKHERDYCCKRYTELEKEIDSLKSQLREYSAVWNEKEQYRKRSADLDTLKEQYIVLFDETSSLEHQLKAESEINKVKIKTIDDLRRENLLLEQKLNEVSMMFEKEKLQCSSLQCTLKEYDCKLMCQDQQIKSLSIQIDRLLEQDHGKVQSEESDQASIALRDEINSLNEQIKNLKNICCCNDEEKQQIEDQFQNKLNIINDLKMEIEYWKSEYKNILQRNDYLEKDAKDCRYEIQRIMENNNLLTLDVEEKSVAIENLMVVINQKSQEVTRAMEDMEKRNSENNELYKTIHTLQEFYNKNCAVLNNENSQVIKSLQLAKQESQELLEKVKDYDDLVHKQDDLATSFQAQNEKYNHLKSVLMESQEINKSLQMDLSNRDSENSILHQQLQTLQTEKDKYKLSIELTNKESATLKEKVHNLENVADQLQKLKDAHEKLTANKIQLENELQSTKEELDDALHLMQLKRQESEELVNSLQGSSENLKLDFSKLNEDYTKITNEKQSLQNELINKKDDYNKLLLAFNQLQSQNEHNSLKVDALNHELSSLKRAYDNLASEKNILQSDFDNKTGEFNNVYNDLELKIEENKTLRECLMNVESDNRAATSNMKSLLKENISTKTNLDTLRKESEELIEKVKYYEAVELEYDRLKQNYDQILAEKNKLEQELDQQVSDKRRIERENHDLSSQSQNLLSHNEHLEKALINARPELIAKSSFQDNPHAEIIREIEEMKQEKIKHHAKIGDLLDKLDESENEISNLSELISDRNDKIAVLENYINELEDEVRKLHNNLAEVVNTGEQITGHSSHKINQSLMTIEAHHSRATHNMKMEIAKLQSVNTILEERLSVTQMSNEEISIDKHKYLSQISHLQNEREIIVTDIKKLEMKSIGDSKLSPEKCDVEDILVSLDRIRRFLDARISKNTSLEQTLLSVQNSYELVQTKTDEAKKIVEKEKQKIINDKEEAIRDKISMEKHLYDLKKQLEQQISNYKNVIDNLKAEILNQKLIIDKVNQSAKSYIFKLEGDMKSLQKLYQESEDKLKSLTEENSQFSGIIEKTSRELEEKIKEIEMLKKALNKLKKEPGQNISIQTSQLSTKINVGNQTDSEIKSEKSENLQLSEDNNKLGEKENTSFIQVNETVHEINQSQSIPTKIFDPISTVQVLTANVNPSSDYVKNGYLNFKLKQLSPGRLEHFSISCATDSMDMINEELSTSNEDNPDRDVPKSKNSTEVDPKIRNTKVIYIYNTKSMDTNSSKAIDNDDTENEADDNTKTNQMKSPTKSSAFTGFKVTNGNSATESNINNDDKNNKLFASASEVSADKDLFIIYRDSESNHGMSYENKEPWNANENSEIVVEAITIQKTPNVNTHIIKQQCNGKNYKKQEIYSDYSLNAEEEYEEYGNVKHKLKISLPRVDNDSPSIEAENKSLDSYTMGNYPPPKEYSSSYYADSHNKFQSVQFGTPSTHSIVSNNHQYKDATNTKIQKLQNVSNKTELLKTDPIKFLNQHRLIENESRQELSRVGAEVLLLKSEDDRTLPIDSNRSRKSKDFGLKYIIDSHKDPNNIKTYNAAQALRKTRSDEIFTSHKEPEKSDSSPSRLSELKKSSTDNKTLSSNSYSKSSQPKSYTEQCVMVKLDTFEEYEKKIQNLTITLENIEKDYKTKKDVVKMQYDNSIKSILNEHNLGVESIQSLHEEALLDIRELHENEVENLRTMSIEAMRKADKLEKENKLLKNKLDSLSCVLEEPTKIATPEFKRRKKSRIDSKLLTKTSVEAFNVRPKNKLHGPCTCSVDINISDTIRNIFEQVDVEQRKKAEYTYLKYIANKIMRGNVDALDTQELSFLHLKVCRIWKMKLTKEESLKNRIDLLEAELLNKQKNAQQNIAELDRKVAEERRRLQEAREAVCRNNPTPAEPGYVPPVPLPTVEKEFLGCSCVTRQDLGERQSHGDLAAHQAGLRQKRMRNDRIVAALAKLDIEERREREKKIYTDDLPTRLRKSHNHSQRTIKK